MKFAGLRNRLKMAPAFWHGAITFSLLAGMLGAAIGWLLGWGMEALLLGR